MNMKLTILFTFLTLNIQVVFAQNKSFDSLAAQKQIANLAYPLLYKENSELSYTSPLGEIGAPSGYIINGKLTTTYMVLASKSLPVAFSINPDFTVRVRDDQSAGVRTPSFKLGGALYLRLSRNSQRYKYVELSFTHHSNGQDGKAILPNGDINTRDGNFNTNYLSLGYRFGYFTEHLTGEDYFGFHHKVGLQWHKWFAYEPALTGDYGFTRLNYDFSFRVYKKLTHNLEKERWRLNGSVSYAVNSLTNYPVFAPKKRLNAELSANYSFPFMQNVFVMVTFGYYGEDPYNIYFKDKYTFMRFGLARSMGWR
ncbi:MAG: hypothetical protein V4663_16985 [Bacteroidota bacterium]